MVSLVDIWIKAAVERRILIVDYFDKETKTAFFQEEIEPHYIGFSQNGGKRSLFGALRNKGLIVLETNSILRYTLSNNTFTPVEHVKMRRTEMIYDKKVLKYKKIA
ncbi:MAG: hypothetical protein WC755_00160 [Candidatus Woesearchaeota archaeon]|jgi:hypothetical protein